MANQREVQRVPGQPEVVASRAAARLAYLGDIVEPVSATEFVWRPQPAEQRLFRCPRWARVRVLADDQHDGQALAVVEWPPSGLGRALWLGLGLTAAGALAGLAAWVFNLLGGHTWLLFGALIPGLAALAAPTLLDSGWRGRLTEAIGGGRTPGFEQVPAAEGWLTLTDRERSAVLTELQQVPELPTTTSAGHLVGSQQWVGRNERSTMTLGGWPVWHVATGRDGVTGTRRVARGWYARGQFAQGLFAIGQAARGWLAIGQLAIGLLALGQAAFGLFVAVGQLAVGGLVGLGMFAIGLFTLALFGVGLFITMLGFTGGWLGLIGSLVGAGVLGALAVAGALMVRSKAEAAERQVLLGLADRLADAEAVAEDSSLSPAPRATGQEADRGLSMVEVTRSEP